jgi:hypothetical protein
MSTVAFKRKRSHISKDLAHRVRATNIAKGNVRESAGERDMVRVLRTMSAQVEHHPERVQGFDVDVYVADVDVYLQFDGIYYHGLDRAYEDLSPEIRRKFDRDRLADRRFPQLGLRLVRVIDQDWNVLQGDEAKRGFLLKRLAPGVE